MAPFDLTLRRRRGRGARRPARIGTNGSRQAHLRRDPARFRAARSRRRADDRAFAGAVAPRGMAFCPEDRKAEGIFAELTVRENIILGLQTKRGWLSRLSRSEQERLARGDDRGARHRDARRRQAGRPISGGNQQKVVLARSLVSDPRILILDEPTRGIDVGAHAEIVSLIRKLCGEGLALLVASSELDELVAVSDRIAVLRDRRDDRRDRRAATSPARPSSAPLRARDRDAARECRCESRPQSRGRALACRCARLPAIARSGRLWRWR